MAKQHPFKRGDKVRCIEGRISMINGQWIKEGETYTVEVTDFDDGEAMLTIAEFSGEWFYATRFVAVASGNIIDAAIGFIGTMPPPLNDGTYEPESFVGRTDIDWTGLIKGSST